MRTPTVEIAPTEQPQDADPRRNAPIRAKNLKDLRSRPDADLKHSSKTLASLYFDSATNIQHILMKQYLIYFS